MPAAQEVVREFCDAVSKRDTALLRPLLGDDIVYHNVGMAPTVGLEATLANLAGQWQRFTQTYEFRVLTLAADGDVVLTERIDTLAGAAGPSLPIPVMGAFEVRNGKIVAWRDYFDPTLIQKLMTGQDVSALVPPAPTPAA